MTYTVKRTPGFDAEFAQLTRKFPTVQDILDGLVFVLARTPKTHPKVPGTKFRVAVSQLGEPHLRVYYTVEGRQVTLVSSDLAV